MRDSRQGWRKAAATKGKTMDAAMPNRILPDIFRFDRTNRGLGAFWLTMRGIQIAPTTIAEIIKISCKPSIVRPSMFLSPGLLTLLPSLIYAKLGPCDWVYISGLVKILKGALSTRGLRWPLVNSGAPVRLLRSRLPILPTNATIRFYP